MNFPRPSSGGWRRPEVSVVIPCLDEAENAACYPESLFRPLEEAPFACELIFSDGGSSDGTPDALEEAAEGRSWVRVLRSARRLAFGASIARALPFCSGVHIALMEADLSFSPADLVRLLSAAEAGGFDCVCGSPFLGSFEGLPPLRRLLTGAANGLLRLRFGPSITSYTQIFKLYRADVLRSLDFESTGFALDAELLAKCLARGGRVGEVPVTMRARTRGRSKLDMAGEVFSSLRLLARGVASGARP